MDFECKIEGEFNFVVTLFLFQMNFKGISYIDGTIPKGDRVSPKGDRKHLKGFLI